MKPSDPTNPCVQAKTYCGHCKFCGKHVREGLLYCAGLSVCWKTAAGIIEVAWLPDAAHRIKQ